MLLTDDCNPEPLNREDIREAISMQGIAGIELKQIVVTEQTDEKFQELCLNNGETN